LEREIFEVRFSHFSFSRFLPPFQFACADALFVFVLMVCFDAGPSSTMATVTPTADEELQKANEKLNLAESELTDAKAETPPSPERIAEAKMGVAKAEMGVAKAEMGVAEAKWESAVDQDTKITLKGLLDIAQKSVEDAIVGVKFARRACENLLDAAKGERSPKPHAQNVEPCTLP
jgi:hypothetical protein